MTNMLAIATILWAIDAVSVAALLSLGWNVISYVRRYR
jgi:hypothetical protein